MSDLDEKNKALARANANIANLYLDLEEQNKSLVESQHKILALNDELIKKNDALSKANANISNLYVDLENSQNELKIKNDDLTLTLKEMSHINEVTRAVNATFDINTIMSSVLDAVKQAFEFEGAIIQLLDESRKKLSTFRFFLKKSNRIKKLVIDTERDKSKFSDAINLKKYTTIYLTKNEDNSPKDIEICKKLQCNLISIFPLQVIDITIGCISFFSTQKENINFNSKTVFYLNNIFLNIGTSINNSIIYNDLKGAKIKLAESKKIARMNVIFEKFVPKQFLRRISSSGIDKIKFGYAVKECATILFSDIRAFTSISENLDPNVLLKFVNEYFQYMNIEIYKNGGFIDKFIGDAIMAIFEHSAEEKCSQATRAVNAGICMINALEKFNLENKIAHDYPIQIGIGIHTGEVILGTVGSEERIDTTVLGDNVNIASRLQVLTKEFSKKIIISRDVYEKIENPEKYIIESLGTNIVKGRKRSLEIFFVEPFLRDL